MYLRNFRTLTMLGAASVAMSPSIAKAQVVYSQAPNFSGTGFSSGSTGSAVNQLLGDKFTLSSAGSVNQVEWWGGYYGADSNDDFKATVYTEINGHPNASSNVSLDLGAVTTIDTGKMNTGGIYPNFEVYEYSADLATPVSLAAGTPYYFSVVNDGAGVNWTWAPTGTDNLYASSNGVDWSDYTNLGANAFELSNTSISVTTSNTPEPGANALLGSLGMGGFALLRRRRRR